MKKRQYNLTSIKAKLFFIAGGIALFFIGIGAISFYYLNVIEDYGKISEPVKEFMEDVAAMRRAEKDFLIHDLTDVNFYETGYSPNVEEFNETYSNINENIENYRSSDYADEMQLEELEKNFSTVIQKIDDFAANFNELVAYIQQRGYKSHGKVGQWESIEEQIMRRTLSYENLELTEMVYEARILRGRYMTSKEPEYLRELQSKVQQYNALLSKNDTTTTSGLMQIPFEERQIIIENLNEYVKTGNEVLALDNVIGLTTSSGMVAEARQLEREIEQAITLIFQKSNQIAEQQIRRAKISLVLYIGLVMLLTVGILLLLSRTITQPIEKIKKYIRQLTTGRLPQQVELNSKDEISQMSDSLTFFIDSLKKKAAFAKAIGKRETYSDFEPLSEEDMLGNSLLEMQNSLKEAEEEEKKRKIEDEKRSWATQGITRFNDILRQNSKNIEELSYDIIRELVKYLDANQGMLFVINDENKNDIFLEMKAAFAYERRKYLKKDLRIGEGISGRCAQEKETVYLEELPEGYFEISSALGQAEPKAVLNIPMLLNEQLYGIIEVASFHSIKPYQIEFAEKVAETVASSISSIKINNRTAHLLEESKMQAEELASKEEEMRQNMEELQATQEEAARKEAEASGFVSAVNHSIIRADYELDGQLSYANTKFLRIMGYDNSADVYGKNITEFMDDDQQKPFMEEWQRVTSGGKHIEREMRYKTRSSHIWVLATYTPIRDIEGNVVKILYLAIDIEEQKEINLDFQGQIEAINRAIIKADYTCEGIMLNTNKQFEKTFGWNRSELINSDIKTFVPKEELDNFVSTWNEVAAGHTFIGRIHRKTKDNKDVWIQGTYSPVRNIDGHVYKIIFIGYDITNQIVKEAENKRLLEESQKMTEEIGVREEELRQNMEEMQQVQAEMAEKDRIMTAQLEAINSTSALVEMDMNGVILKANNRFSEIIGYVRSDLIDSHYSFLLENKYKNSEEYKKIWDNLKNALSQESTQKVISKSGKPIYLQGTFTPMLDQNGKPYKVLFLAFDITQNRLQQSELSGQLEAINQTNALVEMRLDGTILKANSIFCELTEYQENELLGRNHSLFVEEEEKESAAYREFWLNLRNGIAQNGEFRILTKNGKTRYLKSTFFPILDTEGRPYKIMKLAVDVTENKKQAEVLKQKTEELTSSEEELRQNLEELQATQEEMARKQTELEKANKKMQANENVLRKAVASSREKEKQLKNKEQELAASEEELRQNLEELQATQDEMARKQTELEKANKKMTTNEEILKKAVMEARKKEKELQQVTARMKGTEAILQKSITEAKKREQELLNKIEELEKRNK